MLPEPCYTHYDNNRIVTTIIITKIYGALTLLSTLLRTLPLCSPGFLIPLYERFTFIHSISDTGEQQKLRKFKEAVKGHPVWAYRTQWKPKTSDCRSLDYNHHVIYFLPVLTPRVILIGQSNLVIQSGNLMMDILKWQILTQIMSYITSDIVPKIQLMLSFQ